MGLEIVTGADGRQLWVFIWARTTLRYFDKLLLRPEG